MDVIGDAQATNALTQGESDQIFFGKEVWPPHILSDLRSKNTKFCTWFSITIYLTNVESKYRKKTDVWVFTVCDSIFASQIFSTVEWLGTLWSLTSVQCRSQEWLGLYLLPIRHGRNRDNYFFHLYSTQNTSSFHDLQADQSAEFKYLEIFRENCLVLALKCCRQF